MNVLSLFDGVSCGMLALERAGIPVETYAASEIDKYAEKASAHNWPDIVRLGDVRNVRVSEIGFVPDLLLAGSPCQGFSFAGKGLNFNDPRSALFFEFVRILKECIAANPNVLFLLENVPMKREYQAVISEQVGLFPVEINGALVSAQNRNRIFWTNIKTENRGLFNDVFTAIPQPKDRRIFLKDILEEVVDKKYLVSETALARFDRSQYSKPQIDPEKTGTILTKNNSGQLSGDNGTTLIGVVNDNGSLRQVEKSNCIDANFHKGMDNHGQRTLAVMFGRKKQEVAIKGKTPAVTSSRWEQNNHVSAQIRPRYFDENGKKNYGKTDSAPDRTGHLEFNADPNKTGTFLAANNKVNVVVSETTLRRLTPVEVCRLFTLPDNYFQCETGNIISESQQYKCMGNGWIVDVIAHIFSFIPEHLRK